MFSNPFLIFSCIYISFTIKYIVISASFSFQSLIKGYIVLISEIIVSAGIVLVLFYVDFLVTTIIVIHDFAINLLDVLLNVLIENGCFLVNNGNCPQSYQLLK